MNFKIFIIIIAVIIGVSSIWVGGLYIKISRLNADISDLKLTISSKEKAIAEAQVVIERQNTFIENFKLDMEKQQAIQIAEKSKISKRYEQLLLEAKKKQGADMSCENTLNLVDEALRGFMYE